MSRLASIGGGILAAVVLSWASVAAAADFTFDGGPGNVGNGSAPPFDLGTLAAGTSTFDTTLEEYIPFPGGSNHGFSNLYTFSLASESTVTVTADPGALTEMALLQINYSRFSNPLWNNCCFLGASNNDNNNPDLTQPISLSMDLAAGDYEFAVIGIIPPINAPPLYTEAYSGEVQVSPLGGVPEPGAWALMLVGVGAVGASLRARRQPAAVRL